MALRGKKPEAIDKRLKLLLYGAAGVGKTTATIQMPSPYLIDTERGAENDQYVKLLNDAGGAYYFTTDADDMIAEVTSLMTEPHEYRTLAIDPLTVVYNSLLDDAADKVGTDFGRHKGPADRKIKHLTTLLTRLDMNVVITSHAKSKWERGKDGKGKDTVFENGLTYDCYARLDYLFDLVLEIQKRGGDRIAIVRKTRIAGFPDGDEFLFSYDAIAERYGRDALERKAIVAPLATVEQVAEMKRLIALLGVPSDVTDKWLDKAGADSFAELPADVAAKCLDYLNDKIKAATAPAAA